MKTRNLPILLFALWGSLSSLLAQTSTVESNVFAVDTRLVFASNVFSVNTRNDYTVTFDLGAYGTRSGGGALVQAVLPGASASAPTVAVPDGWLFAGWSDAFDSVTADLAVDAEVATNTTDDDSDSLSYYDEVIVYGTDPNKADSSGDGFSDGVIVGLGFDPAANYTQFAQLVAELKNLRIGAENAIVTAGEANLQIVLEESDDLSAWSERKTSDGVVQLEAGESTKFFRYTTKADDD
jgi:hypothetical protein